MSVMNSMICARIKKLQKRSTSKEPEEGNEQLKRGGNVQEERRETSSTKEEVIMAQREPDERAVIAEANGASLPNEQVNLMSNGK